MSDLNLPILDLSLLDGDADDAARFRAALRAATHDVGFFYLTGTGGMTIDDLEHFRALGSKTPGHPEYHHTVGVETTTGPLGQGIATAVGMAILEKGGNAFDAAVATGFVLQIVEPHLNGPAGDLPAIIHSAKTGKTQVICAQGPAPARATAPPRRPRVQDLPWLEVDGERYPLIAAMTVLGRDESADVVLDDPGISRRHCEVRVTHDGPHLVMSARDLGSTNGTYVNGQNIEELTRLDVDDEVRIGRTVMVVRGQR